MTATTDRLPFTGDDEADRLLVADPLALLIGFALDQQVTVQKAFAGPLELRTRLGHPSGSIAVGAEVAREGGEWKVARAIMSRSARRLMEGWVRVPPV